jgi:hypothetical protein
MKDTLTNLNACETPDFDSKNLAGQTQLTDDLRVCALRWILSPNSPLETRKKQPQRRSFCGCFFRFTNGSEL